MSEHRTTGLEDPPAHGRQFSIGHRSVAAEQLDHLPSDHPEAMRSRRDLRRLNRLMGHCAIMSRVLGPMLNTRAQACLAELGAGDGSFMANVAQRVESNRTFVDLALVDRHNLLEPRTRDRFARVRWRTRIIRDDLFEWISRTREHFDAIVANLVLHHFADEQLRTLLRESAARTRVFIAIEPRRSRIGGLFSRMLWAVGCGPVTRHDAPISVKAGFARRELSLLWPAGDQWSLQEFRAGPFSHVFVARRPPRSGNGPSGAPELR